MRTSSLPKVFTVVLFLLGAASAPVLAQSGTTANAITGITVTGSTHQFLADRTGTVTFTIAVAYQGTVNRLGVRLVAPTGAEDKWSFVGASTPTAQPRVGDTSAWEFSYTHTPASPVTFTVTLDYGAGLATANDAIVALQTFTAHALQDKAAAVDASGAPISTSLTLTEAGFHTADSNRDTRIGLDDFLKVLQIYNTRNGTTRTGAYDTSFAPAPNTAPVAPTKPHSADLNRDGAINLLELMRVMDLSMYATAVGRTGEYRADSQGVDGFSPGP